MPCWKRRTAKALGDAGVALAESIALGHEKIPWNQKAVSLGILLSKKAELEGRSDALRVVHTRIVSHGELLKRFSKFKTKKFVKMNLSLSMQYHPQPYDLLHLGYLGGCNRLVSNCGQLFH